MGKDFAGLTDVRFKTNYIESVFIFKDLSITGHTDGIALPVSFPQPLGNFIFTFVFFCCSVFSADVFSTCRERILQCGKCIATLIPGEIGCKKCFSFGFLFRGQEVLLGIHITEQSNPLCCTIVKRSQIVIRSINRFTGIHTQHGIIAVRPESRNDQRCQSDQHDDDQTQCCDLILE